MPYSFIYYYFYKVNETGTKKKIMKLLLLLFYGNSLGFYIRYLKRPFACFQIDFYVLVKDFKTEALSGKNGR